jgi:asparagine synthase (glutamine-hydrolysing)
MGSVIGGTFDGTGPGLETQFSTEAGWHREYKSFGLAIDTDSPDTGGYATWTDGTRTGVIDGIVTNLSELDWTVADVFEHLLEKPADTALALEGGFVIACQDPAADRQLVVTDKLGARPVFYTESAPFRFATSVDALVQYCESPTVNQQAVSDMLLMGNLWGQHTLVEGVLAQRPATVLDVADGERTATRYWKPEYSEAPPGDEYVDELVRRYHQAVERTSRTLPGRVGIWLSGGLDSRTTTGALHRYQGTGGFERLEAYTYDANPPTNDNPRIAQQVADTLGLDYNEVPLTARTVGDHLEQIIEATDGMHMWAYGANLAATYEMDTPPPVMLEGMQGALLGDHLYRHHLTEFDSAVESQVASEASTTPEHVQQLLSPSIDPVASFAAEARRADESSVRETVLDVHFQNYYSRVFMPSNRVMREQTGTRVAQADGDYLEWCARLPTRYRKNALDVPGGPDGGVPCEPTRAKLALSRRIEPALARIPYERSQVKPSRPYPLHVAGFVGNVLWNRVRSRPTYGSGQLADFWIRDTETRLHDRVNELIDDACDRPLFDADAVQAVFDQHMAGANNASTLSQITTVEYWLQSHLD